MVVLKTGSVRACELEIGYLRTSALLCAQTLSRPLFCAICSSLRLMRGVSYEGEGHGGRACCGSIGGSKGVEDMF